jgi:hypothetical protein
MWIPSTLRRPVAFSLCALFALLAIFGGTLVRCEEADGSVRIEVLGTGCCETEPAAPPVEDDCGGCTDEALTASLPDTIARRASTDTDAVPDMVSSPALAPACVRVLVVGGARALFASAEPRPPAVLAAQRTVVLLV